MPNLDLRSIALTLALSSGALAIVLWMISRDRERPIPGIRLWVTGVAMVSFGLAFNATQEFAHDLIARAASNMLMVGGVATVASGLRQFHGKSRALWRAAMLGGAALGVSIATLYIWPTFYARVYLFSMLMACSCSLAAYEFFFERRAALRSAALFGAVPLAVFACLMLARAWEAMDAKTVPTSLTPTPINSLTYLVGGVVMLVSMASMLTLIYGVRSSQLREMAYTDSLTGALNRQGLSAQLNSWLVRHAVTPHIALIDANGFKLINDRRGHEVGDQILRIIVDSFVVDHAGETLFARVGGDEFVLLAANHVLCLQIVTLASTRCMDARDRIAPEFAGRSPVFSFGIAAVASADEAGFRSALKVADARMYENKRALVAEKS
jgi:diguanylate cyclase (GGDEF)-like protein